MAFHRGFQAVRDRLEGIQRLVVKPRFHPPFVVGETGEISLVWGGSGVGKSWFCLWLALRAAEQGIGSAFLLTEGASAFMERVDDHRPFWDGKEPWVEERFTLSNYGKSDTPEQLERELRDYPGGCGLVFVDVLSAALNDENKAGDVNDAAARLGPLLNGRVVVWVHHSSDKGDGGAPRGSTRILDTCGYDFKVGTWDSNDGFGDVVEQPLIRSGRKNRSGRGGKVDLRLRVSHEGLVGEPGDSDYAGPPWWSENGSPGGPDEVVAQLEDPFPMGMIG